MSFGKIASRRNYARLNMNKSAGYISSSDGLDNPLHEAHMLSTEELMKLLESGIKDLSNLTKMDEKVQNVLGIEWDSISASYVPKGESGELSSNLEKVMKGLEDLSAEEREKVLLALGDGGALDAKQASRKRRLKRLRKFGSPFRTSQEQFEKEFREMRSDQVSGIKAEYLQKNNNNLEDAFEEALLHLQNGEEARHECHKSHRELEKRLREIQGLPPLENKPSPTPMPQ